MKRKLFLLMPAVFGLMMTGCGKNVPETKEVTTDSFTQSVGATLQKASASKDDSKGVQLDMDVNVEFKLLDPETPVTIKGNASVGLATNNGNVTGDVKVQGAGTAINPEGKEEKLGLKYAADLAIDTSTVGQITLYGNNTADITDGDEKLPIETLTKKKVTIPVAQLGPDAAQLPLIIAQLKGANLKFISVTALTGLSTLTSMGQLPEGCKLGYGASGSSEAYSFTFTQTVDPETNTKLALEAKVAFTDGLISYVGADIDVTNDMVAIKASASGSFASHDAEIKMPTGYTDTTIDDFSKLIPEFGGSGEVIPAE